jgi:hypothetical protein
VLTIPLSVWGPVSAPFALDKAKALAPAFHDVLQSLDGGAGHHQQSNSSGRSGNSGSSNRGLTGPVALAMHLGLALLDEADPIHPYARFLYEESSSSSSPPAGTAAAAAPHPLLLGGDALRSLFQASPVLAALETRQRVYASIHGRLFPQPEAAPVPFPIFMWAITRVLSRAISGPGRPLTMVPLFDLLNHSPSPNCDYEVGAGPAGASDVVVRATRDVRCVLREGMM